MESLNDTVEVSESLGYVSCLVDQPTNPFAVMVLAHGAGAPMTHPFMHALAGALAEREVLVVRYNFPYMEAKKKRPDVPAVAHQTVKAVSAWTVDRFGNLPLFLAGKSFGGRMSSQYLAKEHPSSVKGICFYGFPLHPAGKPSTDRAEHLKEVTVPMLFHQGTRDTLATFDLIETVTQALDKATLVSFEGADHSFKQGKHVFIEELAGNSVAWMAEQC